MEKINKTRQTSSVKSLGKAIDALVLITQDCRRLSYISRKLNISKSTVHRLLKTLKEKGIVHQDANTQEYYPGPVLFNLLNNPVKAHQLLIHIAYSKMDHLRNLTGESVSLTVKLGMEKINLLQLNGTQSIIFLGNPKYSNLVWTGATGKAILSQLSEEGLKAVLDNIELIPITPKTVTDKAILMRDIAEVKKRGFAEAFGEVDLSLGSVSAPIRHYFTPACITIVGPVDRMLPHVSDYSQELIKTSRTISNNLAQALQTFEQSPKSTNKRKNVSQ